MTQIPAAKLHEAQMQLSTLSALRDRLDRKCSLAAWTEPAWIGAESDGCKNITGELTDFLEGPAVRLMDRAADGDEHALDNLIRATMKLQGFTAGAIDETLDGVSNFKTLVQETVDDVKVATKLVGGLVASSLLLYLLAAGALYLVAIKKGVS